MKIGSIVPFDKQIRCSAAATKLVQIGKFSRCKNCLLRGKQLGHWTTNRVHTAHTCLCLLVPMIREEGGGWGEYVGQESILNLHTKYM